jgi:hypothetical protein
MNNKNNDLLHHAVSQDEQLAIQVLQQLTTYQRQARCLTLYELCQLLDVELDPLRSVVAALDVRGLVDAKRMRLTMRGFVTGLGLNTSRASCAA